MSVIPQTPRAYGGGGFVSLDPLLGLFPGPDGDLKRSLDPSPTHAPPNPKSWIRPWYWYFTCIKLVILRCNLFHIADKYKTKLCLNQKNEHTCTFTFYWVEISNFMDDAWNTRPCIKSTIRQGYVVGVQRRFQQSVNCSPFLICQWNIRKKEG